MKPRKGLLHEAADAEVQAMWPAVRNARLFESCETFEEWRSSQPWAVRISDSGEAVVLMRWREHLDIVQIREAWCPARNVARMLEDVRVVAEEHGFPTLLSPMLVESAAAPYVTAGLREQLRLVSYKAKPPSVRRFPPPPGVVLRSAEPSDVGAVAELERACFSAFWRHERGAIHSAIPLGWVVVAEDKGEVIGYTLTTLSRGSATLARVAVHPDVRGRGVGRALVSDASEFAVQECAPTLSLCTQESNDASRSLYESMGFIEVPGRMVLAGDTGVRF